MLALGLRTPWMVWWLFAFVASAAGAADDASVYAQIDAYKPVAEAIVVDGNPSDWGAIPAFSDPSGDSGGDPSRDITSVRIAPTSGALAVLIQTAAPPTTGGYAFWIQIDFMSEAQRDVELALDMFGPDGLTYFEETGCSGSCSMDWDESEFAIGSAVEIRVPYADLDMVLPASMQGKLIGSGARSWLRVWTHAIAYQPFYTEVDHGSAVAARAAVPVAAFDRVVGHPRGVHRAPGAGRPAVARCWRRAARASQASWRFTSLTC